MTTIALRPVEVADDDPYAAAHAAVLQWTIEAMAAIDVSYYYRDVDLKQCPAGQAILDTHGEAACRLVVAATLHARHWDAETERVRGLLPTVNGHVDIHGSNEWRQVCGRRKRAAEVAFALLRRALPFDAQQLVVLLDWIVGQQHLSTYTVPAGAIARTVERFTKQQQPGEPLKNAIATAAARLRTLHDKQAKQAATTLEQCLAPANDAAAESDETDAEPAAKTPVILAAAGEPTVMRSLKELGGLLAADGVPTTPLPPDQFPLRQDSPLAEYHAWLSELITQAVDASEYYNPTLANHAAGNRVLALEPHAMGPLLLAACERRAATWLSALTTNADYAQLQVRYCVDAVAAKIAGLPWSLDRNGVFDFFLFMAADQSEPFTRYLARLLPQVEQWHDAAPLTEGERYALANVRAAIISGPPLGMPSAEVARLNALLNDGVGFYLVPDNFWSDSLNNDLHARPAAERATWIRLLRHWLTATGSRPSAKWTKTADALIRDIGHDNVFASVRRWLDLVPKQSHGHSLTHRGRTTGQIELLNDENADALRGMLWSLAGDKAQGEATARTVAAVAQSAYRKVPGVGPRAVKVGNAAVYALSEIGTAAAVGQLAMLKVRVKFGSAQKEIEKAFTAAATTLGLPREEIEELGVPTYGLEDVGVRREVFGDATAELRVNGRDVSIAWTNAGKPVKSVPAKVKADFKEELKELQTAAKDIAAMLPAQSERIDNLMLAEKRWPAAAWRERYLDHPLIGTLARRLIWINGDTAFAWHDGRLVDAGDRRVTLDDAAEVSLWHPIGRPTDEVLAWRDWVVEHGITQPFKQAFREIYLLTDAERRTKTYSNRFAAHVLRQHQFNALCAARGWRNKLRLLVDDAYPPASRELPQFGLRAEFWIEGVGDDTNDSGVYLYVATDQVRFYRTSAATNLAHAGGGGYTPRALRPGQEDVNQPLPLEQVPPLVLSEILRDVDLFVGVGSVGNDPAWQDGGPGGRYREYWQSYGFGDLTATAHTRRDVLARLLPRLTKLRDRWQLTDRFLVVRGQLRTYKIHLGSGNILMEPNDQYLCIVPDRSAKQTDAVLLPFEGDGTLSIILSKAFLLAADDKIADTTITRQIKAN